MAYKTTLWGMGKAKELQTYRFARTRKKPSAVGRLQSELKRRGAAKRIIKNVSHIGDQKMAWYQGFIAGRGGAKRKPTTWNSVSVGRYRKAKPKYAVRKVPKNQTRLF